MRAKGTIVLTAAAASLSMLLPLPLPALAGFTEIIIDDSAMGGDGFDLYDIDGDGDQDIISAFEGDEDFNASGEIHITVNPTVGTGTWSSNTTSVDNNATGVEGVVFKGEDNKFISLFEGGVETAYFHRFISGTWTKSAIAELDSADFMTGVRKDFDDDGNENGEFIIGTKPNDDSGSPIWWLHRIPQAWEAQKIHSNGGWVMKIVPLDANNDGLLDIVVATKHVTSGGSVVSEGRIRRYRNTGQLGSNTSAWDAFTLDPAANAVAKCDLDDDGDTDLVGIRQDAASGDLDKFLRFIYNDSSGPNNENFRDWDGNKLRFGSMSANDYFSTEPSRYTVKGVDCDYITNSDYPDIVVTGVFENRKKEKNNVTGIFTCSGLGGRTAIGVFMVTRTVVSGQIRWTAQPLAPSRSFFKYDHPRINDINKDARKDVLVSEEWIGSDCNGLGTVMYKNNP